MKPDSSIQKQQHILDQKTALPASAQGKVVSNDLPGLAAMRHPWIPSDPPWYWPGTRRGTRNASMCKNLAAHHNTRRLTDQMAEPVSGRSGHWATLIQ